MRIWIYTIAGLLLLPVDVAFLAGSGGILPRLYTWQEGGVAAGGASLYLAASVLLRRPERLYLWGHEFTHLLAAKLFLKKVHGFHITSRGGGKVVMDSTNVAIDLSPYLLPFHALLLFAVFAVLPLSFPWKREAYLAGAAALFTLHLDFTAEAFLHGQPDLTRSGRIFSLALVAPALWALVPVLAAPGTGAGFGGVAPFLSGGVEGVLRGALRVLGLARSLLAA